ncbi:hypothetical protein ASF84_01475 [Pseudomonas sp. Leaf127]|uniref:hypothetical protein n=1 Tax=Pseudomonas sp. Leaf127 TaxID=1736267 RepID=UPI000703C19C|nr:hypothetical protein [Pseudomonas sp. Leaf127]KQQ68257.1 hypothetical protein ASF84_01475 [Pseudomonas sp. Leaf127]
MADQPFQLDELYAAIELHINQHLPGLAYVGTMPDMLSRIDVPAVVIELADFEPGDDPGTGETALVLRLEARIIVGAETDDCHKLAAWSAAQLAILLRMQHWGLEVEAAQFERAGQDWSRPELDSYVVWVVEWTQGVYLGEEEWPWPVQPPGSLVWGIHPDVGPGHEPDYVPADQLGDLP